MSLRSPTGHENAGLRHAGMDCRHPGSQDASGDIHVNLDSSTPCWNDATEGFCLICYRRFGPIFEGLFHKLTLAVEIPILKLLGSAAGVEFLFALGYGYGK
jgi:hypothetical protein